MQDLLSSVERAIGLLIISQAPTVRVFHGQSGDSTTRPCIVIYAKTGEEFPLNSGNNWVSVSVMVKSSADIETEETHKERANAIFDFLTIDDLAEQLTAQLDDFTCFGYRAMNKANSTEDNSFTTELSFEVLACQMDLV